MAIGNAPQITMTPEELFGELTQYGKVWEENGTLYVRPKTVAHQYASKIILIKPQLVTLCRWRDAAKCITTTRVSNCIFCMTAQPQWRAVIDEYDLRQCRDCGRWFSFRLRKDNEYQTY